MDKLRTKLFLSMMKLAKTGYLPRATAAITSRLDAVEAVVLTYPKGEQDAVAAVFDTMCETEPQRAGGVAWQKRLEEFRGIITKKPAPGQAAQGMSLDDIAKMHEEGVQEAHEAAEAERLHEEIIARAAIQAEIEDEPEAADAAEAKAAREAHEAIIETAETE